MPRLINIHSYVMIKTIVRVMYSAFTSIILISIVLAGWTTYAFFVQSSKTNDISKVLKDIYKNQKSVFIEVIDLSKILIDDTSNNITNENKNVFFESELPIHGEEDPQLDQSQSPEDNGENPLGIVIHPSLPELSENKLAERGEEPYVNEQNEFSMSEMEMNS